VKIPVNQRTLLAAIRIGNYFKVHAVRAFTAMQMDPATANAVYLLKQIAKVGGTEISRRDLHYVSRARFSTVEMVDAPIQRLIDHGFLTWLPEVPTKRPGRRPSPHLAIHPLTSTYSTHYTEHTQS
jgi:hypothetical protein